MGLSFRVSGITDILAFPKSRIFSNFTGDGRNLPKIPFLLVNANHQPLDKGMVTFVVPEKNEAEKHQ